MRFIKELLRRAGSTYHHRVGPGNCFPAFQKLYPTKISLKGFFWKTFAFKKIIKVFSHPKKVHLNQNPTTVWLNGIYQGTSPTHSCQPVQSSLLLDNGLSHPRGRFIARFINVWCILPTNTPNLTKALKGQIKTSQLWVPSKRASWNPLFSGKRVQWIDREPQCPILQYLPRWPHGISKGHMLETHFLSNQ